MNWKRSWTCYGRELRDYNILQQFQSLITVMKICNHYKKLQHLPIFRSNLRKDLSSNLREVT